MIKKLLIALAHKSPAVAYMKTRYVATRNWFRNQYGNHVKLHENLIIFESFHSKKYADSPKAIYEYMLHDPAYSDYTFIWSFQEPEKYAHLKNSRTRLVKHETGAYFRAFARAKYWVVNGWISLDVKKRPGQVMLQCWHGTPLKRLRHDIAETVTTHHRQEDLRSNDEDVSRYDYFLSPSRFASKAFTSAFNLKALGKESIVCETGYPRNDFLHTFQDADASRIRTELGIPPGKKVLLYAPTWRDDKHIADVGYEYKSPVDFDLLASKLSGDYVVLFRAHNIVANAFDFQKYKNFVIDVSDHDDINDLYIISDALMTDYSSVFFDYANLRRPIIFYMYDLKHYKDNLRGFYLDLKELPGDVVETEAGVISVLSDLDAYKQKYYSTYQKFNQTYNYLDDGKAAERVVERVFE